jgi:membrane protease
MHISIKKSFRVLAAEVADFVRKDFDRHAYAFTAVFVVVLLVINYEFGLDRKVLSRSYETGASWWAMPLFYLAVYLISAATTLYLRRDYRTLRNPRFYAKSGLFVLLYGFAIGFYSYRNLSIAGLLHTEMWYLKSIISQIKCAAVFLLPLTVLKLTIDRRVNGIYGIARHPRHIGAYLTLFVVMMPFLVLTSFTADFLEAYPQFRPWYVESVFGMSTWEYTLLYEVAYAFDFVMTELVFRGTLVVGMAVIMGRSAVLPMVAVYCSIHFGKPLVEAISSVFGGYILGALAFQTRHIWGGVVVHICIALTMEVMGLVHYYVLRR